MNASYKRYWEPNYLQTTGLTLFAGSIATAVTYPLDFLKTVGQFRLQGIGFRGRNIFQHGVNYLKIMRQMHSMGGGFGQFYQGFKAHFISRIGYLLIRNTVYKVIYDKFKPIKPNNDLTNREKMLISGFAGGLAAFFTTPFETISIRQILDSQIRKQWRRNYQSIGDGLSKITQSELNDLGANAMVSNVIRHVLLNITLTGPYDFIHQRLWITFGDYGFVKPIALLSATAISSFITLPFDNARTRLMQLQADPSRNKINYRSYLSCLESAFAQGHPYSAWAGFYPYYQSMLLYAFLTVEICNYFTTSWKKSKNLEPWQI